MDGSLTCSTPRRENEIFERRAICLVTSFAALLAFLTLGGSVWAQAAPAASPESAIGSALKRAGLQQAPDFGERAARAAYVPRLAMGARTVELSAPGLAARSLEVFAWVRWPLERRRTRGLGDPGPLAARRQELAERAAERLKALAELERRARPTGMRDQVDDELDREELCAELSALGAVAQECP